MRARGEGGAFLWGGSALFSTSKAKGDSRTRVCESSLVRRCLAGAGSEGRKAAKEARRERGGKNKSQNERSGVEEAGEKIFLGWGGGARSPRSGDEAFSRSSPFSLAPVQVPRDEPSSCLRRTAPPPPLSLSHKGELGARGPKQGRQDLSLSLERSRSILPLLSGRGWTGRRGKKEEANRASLPGSSPVTRCPLSYSSDPPLGSLDA